MLVFLVDDDYEDHEIFEMAFSKAVTSHQLVTAENGIEAIEKFKQDKSFKPDIIFLDVNMPRMTGKECVHELRKLPELKNIPMILYSTHDSQKEVIEAQRAGATDFMTKPASISEYTQALQEIVKKHVKS
ncbi:response regulator [Sphingobacteriaceae bacterium]|nr:response regulator [Sphingobacteriaceae bacterium]